MTSALPSASAPIRVLHLRVANFYGGPERQIHLHALAMAGTGFDLRVATFVLPEERPEWIAVLERDGLRAHTFGVKSAYDPRAVKALRRYVGAEAIDIVCSHDYRTTILSSIALRGTRAKWIAFSRGTTLENMKVRAFQGIECMVSRAAHAVVAVSEDRASRLRKGGVPAGKIHVVRNAAEAAAFRDVPAVDLRARHGFSPGDVVCVSVGRFSPEKGHKVLVEAAALAIRKDPRLRFVLLGDGPDLDAVRALVVSRGLKSAVLCPGFAKEGIGSTKGADLLVHPSLLEGLPNTILEAMAVGTPVVATAAGGVPEIVRDGVTGVLVPPGDPEALADAILHAVADRAAGVRMAAAAQELLRREFSFAAQAAALSSIYSQVMAGSPRAEESSAGLSWTVLERLADLDAIAAEWEALLGPNQLFLSPDWIRAWFRHASEGASPYVLVAKSADGRVVGVLPLARSGGRLSIAGAGSGADHLDVVVAPEQAAEVAGGALDHLLGARWSRLQLAHLAEDSLLRAALEGRAGSIPFTERESTVCPYVQVEGDFETYLTRFGGKQRSTLRRKVKRLLGDGAARIERVTEPGEVERGIDRLMALHGKRMDSTDRATKFTSAARRALHVDFAATMARRGELLLAFVRRGDKDLAALYGFRHGEKIYYLQGGLDPDETEWSPGVVLTWSVLEQDVFGRGLKEYDFLDGDEAYKFTWATGVRRLFDVEVFHPTSLGRLSAMSRRAAARVRHLAKRRTPSA